MAASADGGATDCETAFLQCANKAEGGLTSGFNVKADAAPPACQASLAGDAGGG